MEGVVQGVGFRPFVWREATSRRLTGYVLNRSDGVRLEVQGAPAAVEGFVEALRLRPPPQARIERIESEEAALVADEASFEIRASDGSAGVRPSLPADLATCEDCAREVRTPSERRHRYPFTNCTNCGPRYSIVESLPYDRPRTSMRAFPLCEACRAEYVDPSDRRFHAQPIACPRCGPRLLLRSPDGAPVARGDEALQRAAREVRSGRIVALKGLGGYQLLVDATDPQAVVRLRERKARESKPFAVLFADAEAVRAWCELSDAEASALASAQAPIILVRKRAGALPLAPQVAPGNPRIGALLPTTPLHQLLTQEIGRPVVCTSGNLSDEPMCIADEEALSRLGEIADFFLGHDRPIVRPLDDSVARVGPSGLELLRRARGFAPLPLPLEGPGPVVLALGAHLKNTVALSVGEQAIVSQHLGDLETAAAAALVERTAIELTRFFDVQPQVIACDLHPDYTSTRIAERLAKRFGARLERVQHHHAHVAACAAEHRLRGEILGLAWDGTGHGGDGTVWGGEFLALDGPQVRRVARLRHFRLPGGDRAAREPRRSALGLLWEVAPALARARAAQWFEARQASGLLAALKRGEAGPATSSMGRLFDAFSALAGVRLENGFEGQAAMELQFAAESSAAGGAYPFPLREAPGASVVDWEPALHEALADLQRGEEPAAVALRFHRGLAAGAVEVARAVGARQIALAGGCFQNELLLRLTASAFEEAGLRACWHRQLPPNDGSISFGQIVVARSSP